MERKKVEGTKKPKVLIVDDTPENIQVLMRTLKDQYAIADVELALQRILALHVFQYHTWP